MNEEQIIDKVSMIDQWKVSGDSYTQGELDAIGQLLELYYDNKKQLEQEKEKYKRLQNTEAFSECYISKDKIKEKIKETNSEKLNYSEDEYYLENEVKGYAIDKLKELLEEK